MNELHTEPLREIVAELKKIKVFTGMTGIALALMLVASIFSTLLSIGALALVMPNALQTIQKHKVPSFSNTIEKLIMQGKLDEALVEAAERKKTHPNDPYAYYWEAKAYLLKGEPEKAVISLEKTRALAPKWEEEYIQPHLKLAEELIASERK